MGFLRAWLAVLLVVAMFPAQAAYDPAKVLRVAPNKTYGIRSSSRERALTPYGSVARSSIRCSNTTTSNVRTRSNRRQRRRCPNVPSSSTRARSATSGTPLRMPMLKGKPRVATTTVWNSLVRAQVALCGEVQGLRLLDVGCGTGYFAREMARRGAVVTAARLVARHARSCAEVGIRSAARHSIPERRCRQIARVP